jgi:two-component system, chemotaxis family, protein-glutamate methylesterase/glutaminase
MIRVLIAEDSAVQRQFLQFLLEESGEFEVVGTARDGAEAVTQTKALRPDIVLMDCYMPETDGLEGTRRIMEECPTPIVLASATLTGHEAEITFDAMRYGALDVVEKSASFDTPGHEEMTEKLLRTLRLMSEVKVVGRHVHRLPPPRKNVVTDPAHVKIIAMAGSTGAPAVIADILGSLESDSLAPLLVVQHLCGGFIDSFTEWLNGKTELEVCLARHGDTVKRGHVYFAPDGRQMGISSSGQIELSDEPEEDGFRPSATYLFRSVAAAYGPQGLGVLLTGMGSDGATGLLAMRQAGARTVVQNEKTCVVFGMPGTAVKLGAAMEVLPPRLIATLIQSSQPDAAEKNDVRPDDAQFG